MATLGAVTPALPVRDIGAAVEFYRARLGFACSHAEDGFAVLVRDAARIHLWRADDDSWHARADLADRPVRSGAEDFLAGTASCRIATDDVEGLYAECERAGVLHAVSRAGVTTTDLGTVEFAVLDLDGNLLEFYRWLD